MTTRIAVLGGGVAGCTAARELSLAGGIEVDLIEKDERLGGLHRSVEIDGAVYDIGAFVFSETHPYFSAFPGLRDLFVEVVHDPRTITPRGSVDRFPLSPRGYLHDNGALHAAGVALDILRSKARYRKRDSLAAYLRYYLGERMYGASGLRDYIARFYMMDEADIDRELAMQRLSSIAESASLRRNARRLMSRVLGRERPAPWRCYVRPAGGFDQVYDAIGAELARSGVRLRTQSSVTSIERAGEGYRIALDGEELYYDRVISTVPLAAIGSLLNVTPATQLRHMSLVSLFYRFRGDIASPAHYFYNFTPDPSWKRAVVFSRYYGEIDGEHYFTVECTRVDPSEADVLRASSDVAAHLRSLRVLRGTLRYVGGCITPNAYPVLERGYKESLAQIQGAIARHGVEMVGRQGAFRYASSQQVASSARELAGAVARRATHEERSHA